MSGYFNFLASLDAAAFPSCLGIKVRLHPHTPDRLPGHDGAAERFKHLHCLTFSAKCAPLWSMKRSWKTRREPGKTEEEHAFSVVVRCIMMKSLL